MGKWTDLFEQNEDAIFDALVQAETDRHEFKNGSGYSVSVYMQDDGSFRHVIDTQLSYYPNCNDMICIYRESTFSESIDPYSYTKSDIIESVNAYYFSDARSLSEQADARLEDDIF